MAIKYKRQCIQCECRVGMLSNANEKEFQRSGMCPRCFKEAMEEVEKLQPKLTMNNWATILGLIRREIRNRNAFGPKILKGRDVADLRIIEDAIIDMIFEKAKGGKDDKA